MKELLEQLGFTNMTHNLWKHKEIGVIQILDTDTPEDIVKAIYQRGYGECQVLIKSAIGIK